MPPKSLSTFMDNDINSASYRAGYINPGDTTQANIVFIDEAQADSVNSGAFTVGQRAVDIFIRILDLQNEKALRKQLLRWFERGKRGMLVGVFDDGLDYQLDCSVLSLEKSPDDEHVYIAHLVSADTYWRAVNADSDTSWSPSGAGGSHVVSVLGTGPTRLSFALTPTAAPAGVYLYQNIVQLINVPGIAMRLTAFCITLNTATLIAAGQMQDDCSDLRLFDNGVQLRRWVVNPNTASTLVWFCLPLAAGQSLTLSSGTAQLETATAVGTITGSGNASVTVTATGMTGSPKTISVAVLNGDTAAVWAGKVRAALRLDAAVTALFTVTGAGDRIVLQRKAPAANDGSLNIALANGTCTGITAAPTSVNTTAGVLYSVASSGAIVTLDFVVSAVTQAAIQALPTEFVLRHGTEWFLCKKNASSLVNCKVLVTKRGLLGTTQQAHVGGDVFNYIEHPIVMYAGNDSAVDPTTSTGYDSTKPVFSLSASDMTQATYSATSLFYDPVYPNRPGSWTQIIARQGLNSKIYNITRDAASGNPALGMKAAAYQSGASWAADLVTVGRQLYDARKVRRITCTISKYRSHTNWPSAKLQCSPTGAAWTDIFTEATPASAATWTAGAAHTNVDIDDTSAFLRLILQGSSGNIAYSYQMLEALTFTVYWKTANIPSLTLLGWQSNHDLDIRLRNTATIDNVTYTDSIEIKLPMLLNKQLVLDGEAFTAKYDGVNVHSAIQLDDESRPVWVRAWPGVTNTLTIESASGGSIGTLDVDTLVYRRDS